MPFLGHRVYIPVVISPFLHVYHNTQCKRKPASYGHSVGARAIAIFCISLVEWYPDGNVRWIVQASVRLIRANDRRGLLTDDDDAPLVRLNVRLWLSSVGDRSADVHGVR